MQLDLAMRLCSGRNKLIMQQNVLYDTFDRKIRALCSLRKFLRLLFQILKNYTEDIFKN